MNAPRQFTFYQAFLYKNKNIQSAELLLMIARRFSDFFFVFVLKIIFVVPKRYIRVRFYIWYNYIKIHRLLESEIDLKDSFRCMSMDHQCWHYKEVVKIFSLSVFHHYWQVVHHCCVLVDLQNYLESKFLAVFFTFLIKLNKMWQAKIPHLI